MHREKTLWYNHGVDHIALITLITLLTFGAVVLLAPAVLRISHSGHRLAILTHLHVHLLPVPCTHIYIHIYVSSGLLRLLGGDYLHVRPYCTRSTPWSNRFGWMCTIAVGSSSRCMGRRTSSYTTRNGWSPPAACRPDDHQGYYIEPRWETHPWEKCIDARGWDRREICIYYLAYRSFRQACVPIERGSRDVRLDPIQQRLLHQRQLNVRPLPVPHNILLRGRT